jgi:hypothetical protein
MFTRERHQQIAALLSALDADLLRGHRCLFGGGTAIALRFGEFRESVDVDFLVSDQPGYRDLRQKMTGPDGFKSILAPGRQSDVSLASDLLTDQYGIRARLQVNDLPIKFEIVFEGRLSLEDPQEADTVCGISCLTLRDMIASKLLANSDRYGDDSTFSRDLIDLALIPCKAQDFRAALARAEAAYGCAIKRDLLRAIAKVASQPSWLDRCISAMAISTPRALLWQRIRALQRRLPAA